MVAYFYMEKEINKNRKKWDNVKFNKRFPI